MKLDDKCLSAALSDFITTGQGGHLKQLQLSHSTKGTFTLLSSDTTALERWASLLNSQLLAT